jgi:hypothetical protein
VFACGQTFAAPCEAQIYQRQLVRNSPEGRHDLDLNASEEQEKEACRLTGEKQRKRPFFDWAKEDGKGITRSSETRPLDDTCPHSPQNT